MSVCSELAKRIIWFLSADNVLTILKTPLFCTVYYYTVLWDTKAIPIKWRYSRVLLRSLFMESNPLMVTAWGNNLDISHLPDSPMIPEWYLNISFKFLLKYLLCYIFNSITVKQTEENICKLNGHIWEDWTQ